VPTPNALCVRVHLCVCMCLNMHMCKCMCMYVCTRRPRHTPLSIGHWPRLAGKHSVMGRSLALMSGNTTIACATVQPTIQVRYLPPSLSCLWGVTFLPIFIAPLLLSTL
jgi:hypothetical protein